MEYDDNSIYEIITNYDLLKESLKELRDAKREKDGVVLGYVAERYNAANKAIEFLQSMPAHLRKRLGLDNLAAEFHNFANTSIKL
jgi:hypothetical protein